MLFVLTLMHSSCVGQMQSVIQEGRAKELMRVSQGIRTYLSDHVMKMLNFEVPSGVKLTLVSDGTMPYCTGSRAATTFCS